MSLYTDLKDAGIECESYQSDLHIPDTIEAREILKRHPEHDRNAKRFRSEIDGRMYLDVPFAFDPYWEEKAGKA